MSDDTLIASSHHCSHNTHWQFSEYSTAIDTVVTTATAYPRSGSGLADAKLGAIQRLHFVWYPTALSLISHSRC